MKKAKKTATSQWRTEYPAEAGYYLAAWSELGRTYTSELWYNPPTGWWTSRGYLQNYDGQRTWPNEPVTGVYAWMDMPSPPVSVVMLKPS